MGWIKAHTGLQGNEWEDKLAKEVIKNSQADIEIAVPFPISVVKSYDKISLTNWQTHWCNSTAGRDIPHNQ